MSSLRKWALVAVAAAMLPTGAFAKSPEVPAVDRLRAFLVYEDSGDLSKNKAKEEGQIVATDPEKGASIQMLLDVVLTGKKNSVYEAKSAELQPMLLVTVHSLGAQMGDPPMVDIGWPLTYMGASGELTREFVVNHECGGFEVEAYVMVGTERTSEIKKTFNITCGD